jgi:hypothetical protein
MAVTDDLEATSLPSWPAFHVSKPLISGKSWVAGPSPVMTRTGCIAWLERSFLPLCGLLSFCTA